MSVTLSSVPAMTLGVLGATSTFENAKSRSVANGEPATQPDGKGSSLSA